MPQSRTISSASATQRATLISFYLNSNTEVKERVLCFLVSPSSPFSLPRTFMSVSMWCVYLQIMAHMVLFFSMTSCLRASSRDFMSCDFRFCGRKKGRSFERSKLCIYMHDTLGMLFIFQHDCKSISIILPNV